MRDDHDFDDYVVARWTSLVSTVVGLGSPTDEAEEVVLATLVRLRPRWRRLRQSEDVDVAVHRELLVAHSRTASTEAAEDAPLSLSDQEPSVPPTPDAIRTLVRRSRARRLRIGLAAAAALALVGALTGWLLTLSTPAESGLAPARTTAADNPAPVAWFANGALHLDQVVIELPPLRGLVVIADGAVYVDRRGAVVQVDARGRRARVGTTTPGSRIEVAEDRSFVVWTDPGEGAAPRPALVVLDVASGEVTDRHPLAPGRVAGQVAGAGPMGVIAVEAGRVIYRDAGGTSSWRPGDERSAPVSEGRLVDTASGTSVVRAADDTLLVHPAGSGDPDDPADPAHPADAWPIAGVDAELSTDGRRVLTREADRLSIYGTVRIYDTRTGAALPTGIGPQDRVITASLGPGDTVTYLVARAQDQPRPGSFVRLSFVGPWQLRTCSVTTGRCTLRTKVASSGSAPILTP